MKKITILILSFILIFPACNNSSNKDKNNKIDTNTDTQAELTQQIKNEIANEHKWKLFVTNRTGVYVLDADTKKLSPIIKGINTIDFCFSKDSNTIYFLHKNIGDIEYAIYSYTNENEPKITCLKIISAEYLKNKIKKNTNKKEQAAEIFINNIGTTINDNILIDYNFYFESEEEYGKYPIYRNRLCINPETGEEIIDKSNEYIIIKPGVINEFRFYEEILTTDSMIIVKSLNGKWFNLTPKVESYANHNMSYEVSPHALRVVCKTCNDFFEDEAFYKLSIVNADGKNYKDFSNFDSPYLWTPTDELLFTNYNSDTENLELKIVKGYENQFDVLASDIELFEIINNSLYQKLLTNEPVIVENTGKLDVEWDEEAGFRDSPNFLLETKDGSFIIVYSVSNGQNASFCIRKRASNGKIIWDYEFGEYETTNSANKIFQTKDNGFIVLSSNLQDETYQIYKLNKDGKEEWNKIFDKKEYHFLGFTQTEDGNFAMLNKVESDSKKLHLFMLNQKCEIKTKLEIDFENDIKGFRFIKLSSAGCVFYNFETNNLMKFNEKGKKEWTKKLPQIKLCISIFLMSENNLILTGLISADQGKKISVIKIDKKGTQLWEDHTIIYYNNNIVFRENPDRTISIAGFESDNSCWLAKYCETGEILSTKTTKPIKNIEISNLLLTSDGGLLISGETFSKANNEYIVRTIKVK